MKEIDEKFEKDYKPFQVEVKEYRILKR